MAMQFVTDVFETIIMGISIWMLYEFIRMIGGLINFSGDSSGESGGNNPKEDKTKRKIYLESIFPVEVDYSSQPKILDIKGKGFENPKIRSAAFIRARDNGSNLINVQNFFVTSDILIRCEITIQKELIAKGDVFHLCLIGENKLDILTPLLKNALKIEGSSSTGNTKRIDNINFEIEKEELENGIVEIALNNVIIKGVGFDYLLSDADKILKLIPKSVSTGDIQHSQVVIVDSTTIKINYIEFKARMSKRDYVYDVHIGDIKGIDSLKFNLNDPTTPEPPEGKSKVVITSIDKKEINSGEESIITINGKGFTTPEINQIYMSLNTLVAMGEEQPNYLKLNILERANNKMTVSVHPDFAQIGIGKFTFARFENIDGKIKIKTYNDLADPTNKIEIKPGKKLPSKIKIIKISSPVEQNKITPVTIEGEHFDNTIQKVAIIIDEHGHGVLANNFKRNNNQIDCKFDTKQIQPGKYSLHLFSNDNNSLCEPKEIEIIPATIKIPEQLKILTFPTEVNSTKNQELIITGENFIQGVLVALANKSLKAGTLSKNAVISADGKTLKCTIDTSKLPINNKFDLYVYLNTTDPKTRDIKSQAILVKSAEDPDKDKRKKENEEIIREMNTLVNVINILPDNASDEKLTIAILNLIKNNDYLTSTINKLLKLIKDKEITDNEYQQFAQEIINIAKSIERILIEKLKISDDNYYNAQILSNFKQLIQWTQKIESELRQKENLNNVLYNLGRVIINFNYIMKEFVNYKKKNPSHHTGKMDKEFVLNEQQNVKQLNNLDINGRGMFTLSNKGTSYISWIILPTKPWLLHNSDSKWEGILSEKTNKMFEFQVKEGINEVEFEVYIWFRKNDSRNDWKENPHANYHIKYLKSN
jgi:hypothetical protein